jgi:hypothetical protein
MITTKRKSYSTPELTAIRIDREITLVMNTATPPDQPLDPIAKPVEPSPFGGNAPDYSGMKNDF